MRKLQVCCLLLAGFVAHGALAQNYPNRPIRIHTSGAGANPDFVTRLVAGEISNSLGQPVIVENRPAGFTLSMGVAKSAPDGYTLLSSPDQLWIGPLFQPAPYDTFKDFAAVALMARAPNILVIHPSLPVKTVSDLIRLAKAKPGGLNYSTGSAGSSTHIAAEMFKHMAGVDVVRISYKDQSSQNADMLSGQTEMTFGSQATWAPMIRSGKLRAIASAGPRRSIMFPDLPTIADTLPGFTAESLLALFAPAATPPAIVQRVSQEVGRAFDKPEVRERMTQTAQETGGGTPEQLAELVRSEVARVSRLIKESGMKTD